MSMWHLQDEEMVSLVFGELAAKERDACMAHLSACPGCEAAFEQLGRAIALLDKEPMEPAPPFAWSRMKARIEQSGTRSDWSEPAWIPLILGNAAGIMLVILFIFLVGDWLEQAPVWHVIRTWPLASEVGPHSLTAVAFFGMGALVTLALTPIFWWESRRPRRRIVK